jgi:uncharacterized protein DUF2786
MTSELAKVKAKIKALAAKTVEAGCSEHEALHAAEMVGRLLDQYNLSMDEIDIREEVCVLGEVPAGSKRRRPIDGAVVPIARFCDVKTWHAKRANGTAVYCFYGFEPDVAMAVHLFTVVAAAVRAESAAFKGSKTYAAAGNRWLSTASFQRGLVDRIGDRLEQLKTKRQRDRERDERAKAQAAQEAFERAVAAGEPPPQHVTRGALMVLKGQIVEREFEANLGITLTKSRAITFRVDPCAFEAGRTAGDRVNLNRPIGQEWNVAGLLA